MRRPGGYAVIVNPDGAPFTLDDPNAAHSHTGQRQEEFDTYRCGHCGSMRHVRARERPEDTGGLCKQCMQLICPRCLSTGRCDPLEKKLERAEARDRALRSYGV